MPVVISLKKHIESNREELLHSALSSYRGALGAMADGSTQACPAAGARLRESLWNLQQRLGAETTPDVVRQTGEHAGREIQEWGESAAGYYKQRAAEFKEILILMARTADAVGERDQGYATQLQQFTARLETVADLQDLTEMRESLLRGAGDLKACVERMARDSEAAAAQLRGELSGYQGRLEAAERLASTDPLTGLDNRRRIETALEFRVAQRRCFSVMLLDLNGFKQINDIHGHGAGDEVLKQFATELRSACRAGDAVGRWGGDEFIVVLDCGLEQAKTQLERVQQWAFGSYSIQAGGAARKVGISAAAGIAEWRAGENAADTLARADGEMYLHKKMRGRG